ncbi:hypothetical protein [Rhizobium sp. BT-226]|uniref:hypothetical protein n=1 Tax=Rhizobium sp. BT-226 TaxID=2986922 RepID=UPI0021F6A065|nr:hypothetical protein [Rhizobium sp. BT-226]MCW0021425.1 hypothetical protein [Rhizobium sp. BT-226]
MPKQEEKGRKRAPDDDRNAAIAPRRSKRLAKPTGIESMPTEIFDRILGEVALAGDERSAAKDLTSVEMVGPRFQKALRASPAEGYRQSLNEAGKAAKRNYSMLPRGKFRDAGPVGADEYVDMVGPGIHLLSPDQQSKVVNKVLSVESPRRRADALNKMASYSAGLSEGSRLRLLDSALDLVEQPHGTHIFHACKAVAKLHAYRTPAQEARMAEVRNRDPLTAATIDGELDAIGRRESTSTVENTPSPPAEVHGSSGYIPVKQRVRTAAEDVQAKVRHADAARIDLENTIRERGGRGP